MASTDKSAAKKKVCFELVATNASDVFLAGTFNEWAPKKKMVDKNGDGVYSCTMMLAPGTYEYKFKVDDQWIIDQSNPNFAPNNIGTLNSVITIQ